MEYSRTASRALARRRLSTGIALASRCPGHVMGQRAVGRAICLS
jgi:hypothetical protein